MPSKTVEERFWSHVDKSGPIPEHLGTPCWIWTAALMHKGYGHFGLTSKHVVRTHTYSFKMAGHEIPNGMQLDHLCFNRACVNPDHLEAVTPSVNQQRRQGASQNSSSGERGVWFDKSRQKWVAEISGSTRKSKRFDDFESARAQAIAWRQEFFDLGVTE